MKPKTLPVLDVKEFIPSERVADFYANTFVAHLRQHAHLILAPHGHNFYVSVLFIKGRGIHEIDFVRYPIKPGSNFILCPGQVHNWKLSRDIDGYIFFHTEEFYNLYYSHEKIEHYPFFCSIHDSRLISLRKNSLEKVEPLYREIVQEYKHAQSMRFQKICSLLNILYIELSRLYGGGGLTAKENLPEVSKVRKLEAFIDKHFKSIKYPKDYAKMMHMSVKHLNRICKKALNKTTSDLISDRILIEAKRMLMDPEHSVYQIADELGFHENSYFFRMFKKKTGQTPMQFMKTFSKR